MNEKTDSMTEKVEAAFRAAVPGVIELARRTQTPIIVWENGRVCAIPADQFEATAVRPATASPSS